MDGAETGLNVDSESQSRIDPGDSITRKESPDKLSTETQAARTGNLNTDKQASPGTILMTSYLISLPKTLQSSQLVWFKLTALHWETTTCHTFWLELSTQSVRFVPPLPIFFPICVGSWVEQMLERADPPNETVEVTRAQATGITDVLPYADKWLFRE